MGSLFRRVVEKMATHDANEERRDIRSGKRLNFAWGWLWLDWTLGPWISCDPYSRECWTVGITIGPLSIEAYWMSDG